MAAMRDSEGAVIPVDDLDAGRPYFRVDLCDWAEGSGPELTMNAPPFETETEVYGGGVVFVPLREVLEEYLKNMKETDGGEGRQAFVEYLRAYASRVEALA